MGKIGFFWKFGFTVLLVARAGMVFGQSVIQNKQEEFIDLALTAGQSQGVAAVSFVHNWFLGNKKRLIVGTGARLTTLTGKNNPYITAGPARLTRSFTTPFLIFFAGQKTENWDTLTVRRAAVTAANITINLGYQFTPKLRAGFNIDAIGASLGKPASGRFQTDGHVMEDVKGKPTAFNLLLTGDHDVGTLNSEFFVAYRIHRKVALRAIYQFLFSEYRTDSVSQIAVDGTVINRFRNKANNFGFALSFYF